jgi:3-hydroxybutyryl-CoA dehydrogenase
LACLLPITIHEEDGRRNKAKERANLVGNNLNNVTIVGTGVQGAMLVFRAAIYGKNVTAYDKSPDATTRAIIKISDWLRAYVSAGRLRDEQAESALKNIIIAEGLQEAVANADIIIENVPEDLELKRKVWAELDVLAPPKTLLATNSSSLRSSEINIFTKRKSQTFNVNFMTPTKDDLVEVMWNENTAESTKIMALEYLKSLEHLPIITRREIKGFSLNRVWRAIKKECLYLWGNGYIDHQDLDRAFVLEWHTEYGPFALMDKVGLDVVKAIELSYYQESHDESDIPPKALDEMIARGELGEKSGKGFYEYPNPEYKENEWLNKANQLK